MWVANGEKEMIAETGWLGPLRARKVTCFPRPLVGVMDLVDAVGELRFSKDGVHAETKLPNGAVVTQIGSPTEARLFSFDLQQLIDHVRRFTDLSRRAIVSGGALMTDSARE